MSFVHVNVCVYVYVYVYIGNPTNHHTPPPLCWWWHKMDFWESRRTLPVLESASFLWEDKKYTKTFDFLVGAPWNWESQQFGHSLCFTLIIVYWTTKYHEVHVGKKDQQIGTWYNLHLCVVIGNLYFQVTFSSQKWTESSTPGNDPNQRWPRDSRQIICQSLSRAASKIG